MASFLSFFSRPSSTPVSVSQQAPASQSTFSSQTSARVNSSTVSMPSQPTPPPRTNTLSSMSSTAPVRSTPVSVPSSNDNLIINLAIDTFTGLADYYNPGQYNCFYDGYNPYVKTAGYTLKESNVAKFQNSELGKKVLEMGVEKVFYIPDARWPVLYNYLRQMHEMVRESLGSTVEKGLSSLREKQPGLIPLMGVVKKVIDEVIANPRFSAIKQKFDQKHTDWATSNEFQLALVDTFKYLCVITPKAATIVYSDNPDDIRSMAVKVTAALETKFENLTL